MPKTTVPEEPRDRATARHVASTSLQDPMAMAVFALPAYVALAVTAEAGCYAVATLVALPGFTFSIHSGLIAALLASFGSRFGGPAVRAFCNWSRWILATVFLPLAVYVYYQISQADGTGTTSIEANITVAVMMAGVIILSILFIGVRYADDKTIPLSAPLVAALSLFGLLNVEVVDGTVGVAFLAFVAAALYLLSYERMLHRWLARTGALLNSTRELLRHRPRYRSSAPPPQLVGRHAAQYLMACSAWFGLFVLGGILLYQPLQLLLPRGFTSTLSQLRGAAHMTFLDWRGSSQVVQLRGGSTPLSDRQLLKVTITSGQSPGLWRGRTYESYTGSQWEDTQNQDSSQKVDVRGSEMTPTNLFLEPIPRKVGKYRKVVATVESLDLVPATVYSPGLPTAVQGNWHFIYMGEDGAILLPEEVRGKGQYTIEAAVPDWHLAHLNALPGLDAAQAKHWLADASTQETLVLPDDVPGLRTQLLMIAKSILAHMAATRHPAITPAQKARAVSEYLSENCKYSLNSPPVPPDEDAVLFFLNNSHVGACDMFASSMTLLLRAMNVPARLVTGYLEPDSTSNAENSGAAADSIVLRERDAHAWVEYNIPHAGWVTADPTQGTTLADQPLNSKIANIFMLPQLRAHWRLVLLPGLGLVLLVIGAIWSSADLRRARYQSTLSVTEDHRRRLEIAYRKARVILRRRVPGGPSQTPIEYEALVHRAPISDAAKQEFAMLTFLFVGAHYGQQCPHIEESQLANALKRLQQSLH